MSFEWHTEEEGQQADGQPWPAPAPSAPSPWRRRLLILFLLLLLGVAGIFARRQVREHVAAVEASEKEAVLASVRLAEQAASKRDQDMLRTVLSGRDPQWLAEQYQLLADGLLLREAGRALAFLPRTEETPTLLDVSFDPELRAAEVVAAHTYSATAPSGEPLTVTLAQTHLYRRGRDRWLLSPSEETFWGARSTTRGRYLSLTYPGRDRQLALRLLRDLDEILEVVCGLPEIKCSPAFQLRVRLEPTVGSLAAMQTPSGLDAAGNDVDLPAPTLVGWPQDERSYQALLRAYAVPIVENALVQLLGYECCAHALLNRALLDWQLHALNLEPWPLGFDDYVLATDYLERPGQFEALWEVEVVPAATSIQRQQAYAAVELLAAGRSDHEAIRLQQALVATPNFASWVRGSGEYPSLTGFMHILRAFLFDRIHAARSAPAAPDQDLLLLCREGASEQLFRYDLGGDSWTRLEGVYDLALTDDGRELIGDDPDRGTASLRIWDQGKRVEAFPAGADPGVSFLPAPLLEQEMADPLGRYLPVNVVAGGGRGWLGSALVDLDRCGPEGCPWFGSTFPLWSPDGQHLLREKEGIIWLQSRSKLEEGQGTRVGSGTAPFWVDDARYGYVYQDELVLSSLDWDPPEMTLSLAALLAPAGTFDPADLTDVAAVPGERHSIALFLDAPRQRQSAVLLLPEEGKGSASGEEALFRAARGHRIFGPPLSAFSPDGRWLVLHTSPAVGGERGEFILHDLATGESAVRALAPWWVQPGLMPAQQFAWSADGRWLARVATHQVDLLAPTVEGVYRRYLVPPSDFPGGADCEAVGWVDEN